MDRIMDEKDVEMEGAQKPDSGNDIKESDDKCELKEDEPPSAVTVVENTDRSENGDHDSDKLSNEAKDQMNAMSGMESPTNHVSEANEPVSVEGVEPTGEKIDTESKNEGGISIGASAEVQAASESILDKLTGLTSDVVEESDANDGSKEENPVENGDESEIAVKNVEGDSSGNVAVEKPRESGETEECVKNVAQIEMAGENATEREMAAENVNNGGDSSENNKLQTGLSSNEAPQVQSDTLVEVPLSGEKETEDAANSNENKVVNEEPKQQGTEVVLAPTVTDEYTKSVETVTRLEGNDSSPPSKHEVATPSSVVRYLPTNMGSHSREADKTVYSQATQHMVMNKSQKYISRF